MKDVRIIPPIPSRVEHNAAGLCNRYPVRYASTIERSQLDRLVLCYHSVSDRWPHPLALTSHAFEQQLSHLLKRGYRGASIDDVLNGSRRGLHVTFDDAFRDILDVIPVLERLRIPATIFTVTDLANEGAPFEVPELVAGPGVIRERTMTLAWEELRELASRGFAVGSHTVTHPHLTELGGDELERELQDSRARIEEELGTPCRFFAYPYGEHDERVQAAVRRAGYTTAFALSAGASPTNSYALPRIDFYRRDARLRARLKTSHLRPLAQAILSRVRARSLS